MQAAILAVVSKPISTTPKLIFSISKLTTNILAWPLRIRMLELPRTYIVIRNVGDKPGQLGFTTNPNNQNNAPGGTWLDLSPGQEYYDVGTTNQIYLRPVVNGEWVTVEIEVMIGR